MGLCTEFGRRIGSKGVNNIVCMWCCSGCFIVALFVDFQLISEHYIVKTSFKAKDDASVDVSWPLPSVLASSPYCMDMLPRGSHLSWYGREGELGRLNTQTTDQ